MILPRSSWFFTLCLIAAATPAFAAEPAPGTPLERKGDEVVACGQLFHTGTPVVLWLDPGGYDAYRVEPRFTAPEAAKAQNERLANARNGVRFGTRKGKYSAEEAERIRGGGWDLPLLQTVVDQFVIHFDAAGTSRRCFEVLQDERGLSVQFMLDLDGTLYQTLDLKESAWHATKSNSRSIGIEIANIGTFSATNPGRSAKWYVKDDAGKTRIEVADALGLSGIRNRDLILRPARNEPVTGSIHGRDMTQYDLTPQQYEAFIRLTATLCTIFPKLRCDYPRDAEGKLLLRVLDDKEWAAYQGLLGHYHVQTNKVDPGPAFQWDRVVDGAKVLMKK